MTSLLLSIFLCLSFFLSIGPDHVKKMLIHQYQMKAGHYCQNIIKTVTMRTRKKLTRTWRRIDCLAIKCLTMASMTTRRGMKHASCNSIGHWARLKFHPKSIKIPRQPRQYQTPSYQNQIHPRFSDTD